MNRRDAIKGITGVTLATGAVCANIAGQPRELTLAELMAWAKENSLHYDFLADGDSLLDALRRAHNDLGRRKATVHEGTWF